MMRGESSKRIIGSKLKDKFYCPALEFPECEKAVDIGKIALIEMCR
jgi:hypothetical protein